MTQTHFRVGQIVPSSNTTMETEIPQMFRLRENIEPERFTFHSARMRMKKVTKEELVAMDADSDRCALELSDARVDVLGYACLVATMSMGHGYHRLSQNRLEQRARENGGPAPVVTSAGALVEGLKVLKAKKISLLTPYMKPLTAVVVSYLENEGFEVVDALSLEISDNLEVGRCNPSAPIELSSRLTVANVDAVVLSACVQMPSFPSVQPVEDRLGLPVVSAATCTVHRMLGVLGLRPVVPNAGSLLSGRYSTDLAGR
ncbi:MAG: Asp/Glu racemase [Burkholderiaceae bacterium]|nr:Asp/Glu racemase [Burkholderiaceae bacterium]MDO9089705.1 Asp/Glu racemase [Burkholderiaceae bacterium]